MLNSSDLKDELLAADLSEHKYIDIIRDYIKTNAELSASYVGVTPSGSPDPLNGPVTSSLTLTIQGSTNVSNFVQDLTDADPNGWLTALFDDIGPLTVTGTGSYIFTVPMPVVFIPLDSSKLDDLKQAESNSEVWDIYSVAIINIVKGYLFATAPTTTASGTGVTTFNSLS